MDLGAAMDAAGKGTSRRAREAHGRGRGGGAARSPLHRKGDRVMTLRSHTSRFLARVLKKRPSMRDSIGTCEPLERRRLLAVVTVTNTTDVINGNTNSIAALIAAPGGDGI